MLSSGLLSVRSATIVPMVIESVQPLDTADLRKARGAFFTPEPIAPFIVDWAMRSADDLVFEPSAGDAQFLVEAVRRLRDLADDKTCRPVVHGVEIHEHSATVGAARVDAAGGTAIIEVNDFFALAPSSDCTAVVGDPPYVRFHDWAGDARVRSRAAALRVGVTSPAARMNRPTCSSSPHWATSALAKR